jgi:hypothetical protein
MTAAARRELEQAFLRVLRAREPDYVWTVLRTPDEGETFLYRNPLTGTGGGSDDDVLEDGAE